MSHYAGRVSFSPRAAVPRLGLICALSGASAILASGLWLWHTHQVHQQAIEARQRALAANDAINEAAAAKARQAQAMVEERLRDPRWQKAQRELNWPWLDTLTVIEQLTRPPLYLLSYKPDAAMGVISLQGEADSLEDALQYVQVLQAVPQFEHAKLLRHEEARDATTGRTTLRFAVQVRRREGAS